MKSLFSLALLLPTFSFAAPLVIGNILPANLNPEQTCHLQSHSLRYEFDCSATLIGKNTLLTSAHCKTGRGFQVTCFDKNGVSYSSGITRFEKAPHGIDMAVVQTVMDMPIAPMKVAKTLAETENLLKTNQCRFSGWSQGDKATTVDLPVDHAYIKSKTFMSLAMTTQSLSGDQILSAGQAAPVERIIFNTSSGNPSKVYVSDSELARSRTANGLTHGDSGGSTYCFDAAGTPTLVGVNQGGSEDQNLPEVMATGIDEVNSWISRNQ